jgi:hypothetical protein
LVAPDPSCRVGLLLMRSPGAMHLTRATGSATKDAGQPAPWGVGFFGAFDTEQRSEIAGGERARVSRRRWRRRGRENEDWNLERGADDGS